MPGGCFFFRPAPVRAYSCSSTAGWASRFVGIFVSQINSRLANLTVNLPTNAGVTAADKQLDAASEQRAECRAQIDGPHVRQAARARFALAMGDPLGVTAVVDDHNVARPQRQRLQPEC